MQKNYVENENICESFEEIVKILPDKLAVIMNEERLTYNELNIKSNKLARLLKSHGIKKKSIVPVIIDKSTDTIIVLFAILKVGAIYLPIDIKYPNARKEYILKDSNAKLVITNNRYIQPLENDISYLILDEISFNNLDGKNLNTEILINDLAYIIYTSGTTGRPKGAMLKHVGILNLNLLWKNTFEITERDKIIQFASVAFDAALWEIFMTLLNGATLYMLSEEIIGNFAHFEKYLNDNNITIATLPPTYVIHLEPENVKSLRILITAGSATSKIIVNKWCDKVKYINAYGPTEVSICSNYWVARPDGFYGNIVPIGKPIDNTNIYILDQENLVVKNGDIGEICIDSIGIATGYLNRQELTAEKFVKLPFLNGETIYKTGDIGRCLVDGNIEYHGRIDNQVKIRGHRIELGEIESQLLTNNKIKQVSVVTKNSSNGDIILAVYYVPKFSDEKINLKSYLEENLPIYMIPNYYEAMDKLPLTINGKIDTNLLENKQVIKSTKKNNHNPKDIYQKVLIKVFKEVLNQDDIGIYDDFYEVGGDSITAIQISAKMHRLGYKLDVKNILAKHNILNISKEIEPLAIGDENEIVTGNLALSPIQRWFFKENFNNIHHFNQSIMIYNKNGFKIDIVEKVFEKLIESHDALRMIFKEENNEIVQINREISNNLFNLEVINVPIKNEYEYIYSKIAGIQSKMNLYEGKLVQIGIFRTGDGDHLFVAIHHLIVDGISYRIIIEDIINYYEQLQEGEILKNNAKTNSFKLWTLEIESYSKSKKLLNEINFWKEYEKKWINKPLDRKKASNNTQKNKKSVAKSLSKEYTTKLLTKVNKRYNTKINDILLTCLYLAMKEWRDVEQCMINLETHGRGDVFKRINIARTVGWFTSQYPLLLINDKCGLGDSIKNIKEQIRKIPNEGIGYEILKYVTPKELTSELLFCIKPEINFNYLGQIDINLNSKNFEKSKYISANSLGPDGKNNIGEMNQIYFPLIITSYVEGGIFNISFSYNNEEFNLEEIETLANIYTSCLEKIILHCINKDQVELTPSDFTHPTLSINDMDRIFNVLKSTNIR
ncbi:amino acid adenylation domain-containing protein [Clostridium gasigenes]|uniref:non-ribosomal peptide synthetase n=1 Tax=Clostridium gasigenes TaxID=94869 RepID=UPI001627B3EE|nr:non-ribosomal peptide synthetase [Clostridium gasigenes]MBB6625541.1 amino acid adenylation domain-containing protein [Clostridium gasigenes]